MKFDGKQSKAAFFYVLVMAGALTAHSYFTTTAAFYLDSARLYPLSQGGVLVLSTLLATLFFKERLTAKAVLGILLPFVSLLLINL